MKSAWMIALIAAAPLIGGSQEKATSTTGNPVLAADFATQVLTPAVPFDQSFTLKVSSESMCPFELRVGRAVIQERRDGKFRTIEDSTGPLRTLDGYCAKGASFSVGPKRANVKYLARVYFAKADHLGGYFACLDKERHVQRPECPLPMVGDSLSLSFTPRATLLAHFDGDLGVIFAPRPGPALVAVATQMHYYFVPVSKDEELSDASGFRDEVLKRVSLMIGLSSVRFSTGTPIENRTKAGNILLGVGLRPRVGNFLDFFRVTAGYLLYGQDDPNPLVTKKIDKHAPFIGVAGNVEIQSILTPILGFFQAK